MTECAGCGDCCEPVMKVGYVGTAIRDLLSKPLAGSHFADRLWVSRLIKIGNPFRQGKELYQRYRCPDFDTETRRCTVYATRPPVCRGYPWYGKKPDTINGLSPRCSYIADIRPMLPIVTINGKDLT